MIARRLISATLFAGALALAVPAVAQKPASAPKNATAQCSDGTYSTAKTERGACSKHGGVKTWWGGAAPTTSRAPTAAATTVPPTNTQVDMRTPTKSAANAPENATAKCKDGTYSSAKQHRGACSRHGGVAEWYK